MTKKIAHYKIETINIYQHNDIYSNETVALFTDATPSLLGYVLIYLEVEVSSSFFLRRIFLQGRVNLNATLVFGLLQTICLAVFGNLLGYLSGGQLVHPQVGCYLFIRTDWAWQNHGLVRPQLHA